MQQGILVVGTKNNNELWIFPCGHCFVSNAVVASTLLMIVNEFCYYYLGKHTMAAVSITCWLNPNMWCNESMHTTMDTQIPQSGYKTPWTEEVDQLYRRAGAFGDLKQANCLGYKPKIKGEYCWRVSSSEVFYPWNKFVAPKDYWKSAW